MLCNMVSLLPQLNKIPNQIKQPAPSSLSSKCLSSGLWDFSILCQTNGIGEENYASNEGEFCIFSCLQNCCFMVKWKASFPTTQGAWLLQVWWVPGWELELVSVKAPVPPVTMHCNQLPLLRMASAFSVLQMRGRICFLCVYCITLKQNGMWLAVISWLFHHL